MTSETKKFIQSQGLLVCPTCDGEGEYDSFCGHYTSETCSDCQGKGIIRSLTKQIHSKVCIICHGREGGCGGCNFHPSGLIEWESFEIY
jgi:DnaJ-class molecular chaperone